MSETKRDSAHTAEVKRENARRAGRGKRGCTMHPLKIEMRELARSYGPEVLETLLKIMRNEGQETEYRIACAAIILERGFGKVVPAPPETGNGQVLVNVVSGSGQALLPPGSAAQFLSDVATVQAQQSGPILPDGTPVFEKHGSAPAPRPVGKPPCTEPPQHRLFEVDDKGRG